MTQWWQTPNPGLNGLTPIYRWNGGPYSEVRELIEPTTPSEERFEEFVDALLRVDPKGLSGKHRKTDDSESAADDGSG